MCDRLEFVLSMFVSEDQGKDKTEDEGVAGEDEPDVVPVLDAVGVCEMIYDPAAADAAEIGAETIGHDHEEALGAGPDGDGRFFFDEQRTGDVEEIEGHAIDDHGKQQEYQTAAGIADAEKTEAEYPGEDTHQHDPFDAKTLQEKGYGENEERFGDLRDRGQQIGMFDGKSIIIVPREIADKGQAEGIGDLQSGAQEHGKKEENGHAAVFEEFESIESKGGCDRLLSTISDRAAGRHGECIETEYDAGASTYIQLHRAERPAGQVDGPHGGNETYCSPYAYRRKDLDDIESSFFEDDIGNGIVEGDGRHVEHVVQQHDIIKGIVGFERGGIEERGRADEMANTEDALGVNPSIRNDAQQTGHEQRSDPHRTVDACHLTTGKMQGNNHISSHRDQPGTPYKKL